MSDGFARWLRRNDPDLESLHKAVKAAVVVTAGLAIGTLVIGSAQLSLFAGFGGVALLLFADFPGSPAARFGGFAGLSVLGAALITLGTVAGMRPWIAVISMAVIGFAVLFGGVLSAAAASSTRAALLTFILPVTVPATAADLGPRLIGWLIAVLLAVPAAVLWWPPRDHDRIRILSATACSKIADQLDPAHQIPGMVADAPDRATTAMKAIVDLHNTFRSTTFRPVGLSTGSRLLVQLITRLEWLQAAARRVPDHSGHQFPAEMTAVVMAAASVLRASAEVLEAAVQHPTGQSRRRLADTLLADTLLADTLSDLEAARVGATTAGLSIAIDGARDASVRQWPAIAHEVAYTTGLVGTTVAESAAADARPLLDRLLGREWSGKAVGPITAAERIAAGHSTVRSVWLQNSARGAVGLALAVLVADVTHVAHGFWVVLGAMSVLRTTAVATGSTVARAVAGTVAGFLVGSGVILLVGTTAWHLWLLLPVAMLIAAYLPAALSFTAGQAAFTVLVMILFNIIQPVGWTVGLVRIEDILLGCLVSLVCGVLLWPRGAGAQMRAALADSYLRSADAFEAAAAHLADADGGHGGPADQRDAAARGIEAARRSGLRLDSALRQYLFERGSAVMSAAELTALTNGTTRLRLAAEAIADSAARYAAASPDGSAFPGDPPYPVDTHVASVHPAAFRQAGEAVRQRAVAVANWYRLIAADLGSHSQSSPPPAAMNVEMDNSAQADVLQDLLSMADRHPGRPIGAGGQEIWTASLYVDGVARLQQPLLRYLSALAADPRGRVGPIDPVAAPVDQVGTSS